MSSMIRKKSIISGLVCCAAVIFSLLSLNYFVAPFVWLGMSWLAVTLYFFAGAKEKTRLLLINVIVVLFTLTSFEAFVWLYTARAIKNIKQVGDLYIKDFYFRKDDILGYSPNKNVKANTKKYYKDQLLYDVDYTIDEHGLRQSPPCDRSDHHEAIIFFGCSFAFGEGLKDHETIPYQVGTLSGGAYQIYNFGFHGYGPHQMLAAIENGYIQKVLENSAPTHIIYIGLVEHALRSAGKISWDNHAPRYSLQDGHIYHAGRFDDGMIYTHAILAPAVEYLKKSHIYQKIAEKRRVMTDEDLELFLEIVERSQIELAHIYPAAKFHVIMWNDIKYDRYEKALNGFKERKINAIWINEILPNYTDDHKQYRIHRIHEKHPNALANQIVARYILEKILTQ
ncbi:hypothetical protein JW998_01740 [candidate division KSB1 bacterium]|nr:hypothetical protein [candidate division KSB1 bacterium]